MKDLGLHRTAAAVTTEAASPSADQVAVEMSDKEEGTMDDRARALTVTAGGLLLAIGGLTIPADSAVDSLAITVAVIATIVVTAVVFWVVLPKQSTGGRPTAGLVLGILAVMTCMVAFYFAAPYALATGAVVSGRQAGPASSSRAKIAIGLGVIALLIATVMNLLGVFDVLPDWPPQQA